MKNIKFFLTSITIIAFFIVVTIIILLTNYKQETLTCSKAHNICNIEKINLLNMKSSKKLVNYDEIADVSYIKQKIKGNRYAQGYTEYLLDFILKNNNRKIIFSKSFYEKTEIDQYIRDLRQQMFSDNDKIIINRN